VSAWHGIAAFAAPAAMLALALALSTYIASLPPQFASLAKIAPEAAMALAALLAIAFQRGRIFFAIVTLAIAYFTYRNYLNGGLAGFTARTVFASMCILVPVNLAALAFTRERGIFNLHGLLRVTILLMECGVVAWLIAANNRETVDWLYSPLFEGAPLLNTRIPQMSLTLMATATMACIALWWFTRSAIDLAFGGATAAWAIAVHGGARPELLISFTAAAALILAVAVLQDAYRMAFRDELTGVPGRRALNEHLARLGRRFVIAVIDIDHFKKFNDTHGHDVGDQVLKMVATRIERVRGGGKAYRFGGEEFVIVFAGATIKEAMPHLEALRIDVADHGLTLRDSERAEDAPQKRKRKSSASGKNLSVTISIGVAERSEKLATPADVLTAADKALYRAKHGGRNKVSQ
jgi:diguanylate cyclase (GGDEF)-like protein